MTDIEHEHGPQLSPREVLDKIRIEMQTLMDPRQGDGRVFNSEFEGRVLVGKLGVDTPAKALGVLRESIEAGYDPMTDLDVPSKDSDITWSTVLSGLLQNESKGSVRRGDPEDNPKVWLEKIEELIEHGIIPDAKLLQPIHAIREVSRTSPDAGKYWLEQLLGLTLKSVKLASKRTLSLDGFLGYRKEDDRTVYPSSSAAEINAQSARDDTSARAMGRRGWKLFGRS